MPTYSYRCSKCEKTFDAFHSMMCNDAQFCPECGGEGKKLMSASSVIFKGSGFYSTDYRDSGYLEAKKKDSSSGSGNGSSSGTEEKKSSAEKPAEAPAAKPDSSSSAKSDTPKPAPAPVTPNPQAA